MLNAATALRSECATVPDDLAARMPLAYVHFVQVLTDVLCALSPFALYPSGGGLGAVLLSGVIIFFFSARRLTRIGQN